MVLFDYCLLARCFTLLHWNRRQVFTGQPLLHTFFPAPVQGNVLQGLPAK
jgi:hypothetical protein